MPRSYFDQYLNDLVAQKFPESYLLSAADREKIKIGASRRLDNFIMSRAIPELSEEDVHHLEVLLKNNQSADMAREFVATHIPNFTDFLTATLREFSHTYLGS
jgi:hypothetical protein